MSIGTTIKKLRRERDITQEQLAEYIGISSQAVSQWETDKTAPDISQLPLLAHIFDVTTDEILGCNFRRDERINAIIKEADELGVYDNGKDVNIEKRLTLLRNGLVEFPRNEKLLYHLAATLSNAGWARVGERIDYDENGYLIHTQRNLDNEYWIEAIKIYETLLSQTNDPTIINDSSYDLTLLYCNMGQHEKGLALAEKAAPLYYGRELAKANATDGVERREYYGRALLYLTDNLTETAIGLLTSKKSNFDGDLPLLILCEIIRLFETIFDDGNFGPYNSRMCDLYLYLSEHQWRNGLHDEAFDSLERALKHAKTVDALAKSGEKDPRYTARLISGVSMEKERWAGREEIAPRLPEDWPMWMMPNFDDVKAEMSADPRWTDWVNRCKES